MLTLLQGDAMQQLPTLPAESVQCCVTSPPYWGLRDYGVGGQLGLEATPEEFVANMVEVFREVRRVLRNDGTLWLNLGDSYASNGYSAERERKFKGGLSSWGERDQSTFKTAGNGLKPKDLCGIPWRVAFALQADGWYLRSDIIWHKPNPMPESVTDRPTKSHEYIFLLTKSERYFYDADAIREPYNPESLDRYNYSLNGTAPGSRKPGGDLERRTREAKVRDPNPNGRNKRTVWTISTQPYSEAHFATFPEELPKLCIMAGSRVGDLVLDPFGGSGTTGRVAIELGRRATLIELNPAYVAMIRDRCNVTTGML